jgi:hypothetical protein
MKTYTFFFDKVSLKPACVLLQAVWGGDREACFFFPEWELAPTSNMIRISGTEEQIEKLAKLSTEGTPEQIKKLRELGTR